MATRRGARPRRGQDGYSDAPSNLRVHGEADEVFEVGERVQHGRAGNVAGREGPAMIVIEGVREVGVDIETRSLDVSDFDDEDEGFTLDLPGGENVLFDVDATRVQLIYNRGRADQIRALCQPPLNIGRGTYNRTDPDADDDGTFGIEVLGRPENGKPAPTGLTRTAYLGKHGAVRPELLGEGLARLGAGERTAYFRRLADEIKKRWPSSNPNEPADHMRDLVMALEGYDEGHTGRFR